ncbi:MmcQ/YjbR family DNA-binding protein [Thomasclavelia ramosa]|uniref:MmcQ/YjbR family DNA-binding protein n=1 Tax=Thomasclavelia ramosa TaxID=1547 RepID=UPI0022E3BB42
MTLKLRPENGMDLQEQHEDIIPGYYMNKKHWNSIKVNGSISDQLLKDMLDEAYELVLSSFSKKRQLEILSL